MKATAPPLTPLQRIIIEQLARAIVRELQDELLKKKPAA